MSPTLSPAYNLLAGALMFLIGVVGVALSFRLRKSLRVFGFGTALAAGVMFGAAIVHLLPEAEHALGGHHDHSDHDHSAGHSTCRGGHCSHGTHAHAALSHSPNTNTVHGCSGGHGHCGHNHNHAHSGCDGSSSCSSAGNLPTATHDHDHDDHDHHDHDHHDHDDHDHGDEFPAAMAIAGGAFVFLLAVQQVIEWVIHRRSHDHVEVELKQLSSSQHNHASVAVVSSPEQASSESQTHCCDHPHEHSQDVVAASQEDHQHGEKGCCDVSRLEGMSEWSAVSLFLAMCVHAVLEGMMMGAARKHQVLWMAFGAVGLHKVFETFAVGASILEARMSKAKFMMYSLMICLASPLGAAIGFALREADKSTGGCSSKSGGIINALAAGTFLQVATMEMIPRSFNKQTPNNWRLERLAACTLGFAVVVFLTYQFPHPHEDH